MTAPTAGWLEGREHVLPVRIYYEDTDFTGIVYHANYLRYFERGRSDFLRVAGVHHAELIARPDPTAFAVVRMEIDFKQAGRIDDALLVRSAYTAARGPRVFFSQRIMRGEVLLCQAQVEAAWIDGAGRPRKPPRELLERLSPFLS